MKSVTMSRQTAASDKLGNYRLDLTITSANDITPNLFVKQRIIKPDGSNDDTFVAVASPAEIEDIPEGQPTQGDVYFRDSTISLISSDPDFLASASDSIIADVQLTIIQAAELDNLVETDVITIDSSSVVFEDPTAAQIIVGSSNVRIKDGALQVFDPGYAAQNPDTPWCTISVTDGVISTSTPQPT